MDAEYATVQTGHTFLPASSWNVVQFGLACSYTLCLSSFWTFPYLVYRHTGFFLVAYYILLVVVCCPLVFVQLKLGGVFKRGIVSIVAHFVPALKGVGVAALIMAFILVIRESALTSQAIYYMCISLQQPFPWTLTQNTTGSIKNYQWNGVPDTVSADKYYFNTFLQASHSLSDPGVVPWHRGVALLVTWILLYLMIFRGPGWTGKVVYVTSPLSLLLLFVLLIYTHSAVPDSYNSLKYIFSYGGSGSGASGGEVEKNGLVNSELAHSQTWMSALQQHILGLCLWTGLLPTLGSHVGNKKPTSYLTWILVLVVHSVLPQLVTITLAPLVHALSVVTHTRYTGIDDKGPYLMFVVIPEAMASVNVAPFWAFALYLCLTIFALHQQGLLLMAILENLVEFAPEKLQAIFRRRELLTAALCCLAFLLALPQVTQGGLHLSYLVEKYVYRALYLLILLNVAPMVIAYLKMEKLNLPIERICVSGWLVLASIITVVMLIYQEVSRKWDCLPAWGQGLGWLLALTPTVGCTAVGAVHTYSQTNTRGLTERLKEIFKPPTDELDSLASHYLQQEVNGTLASQPDNATLKVKPRAPLEVEKKPIEVGIQPDPDGEVAHV